LLLNIIVYYVSYRYAAADRTQNGLEERKYFVATKRKPHEEDFFRDGSELHASGIGVRRENMWRKKI